MKKFISLKKEIRKYLDFSQSSTIVGMQDDGLGLLKTSLISENKHTKDITFVGVNLGYLQDISLKGVEDEINFDLERDDYPGDTIMQTIDAGFKVVAVVEDILFSSDLKKAIESCDMLIKKYRGMLLFIYLIEHATFLQEVEMHAPQTSSIIDAVIYHKINTDWNKETLTNYSRTKFNYILTKSIIDNISQKSNNHFGIFTRMYRDKVISTNHTQRYLENVVDEFSEVEISTFKKLEAKKALDLEEQKVRKAYENVGLLDSNGFITIPIVRELVKAYRYSSIDSSEFIDMLSTLTKSERAIFEYMKVKDVVSKAEISDLIWAEKSNDKYSEWAIDQRMSRLRRKLEDIGAPFELRSIYGSGYKLTKIS